MKGYRTIGLGALLVMLPPLLKYAVGVPWDTLVPAPWGTVIAGVLMIVMRVVTTTPVGQK